MPIDVSIYRNLQPPPTQNPLTMLSELVQAQQGIGALRKQRQEEADQAAVRQVLADAGGNIEQALPQLRKIAPAAALKFETELGTQRKNAFEALKAKTDLDDKQLTLGLRYLQGVKNERGFQVARRVIGDMDPGVAEMLGDTYDADRVQQILDIGLSAKELNDQRRAGLEMFGKGDHAKALATYLATAQNQEDWNGMIAGAQQLGVPDAIIAPFGGTFSPEAVARAQAIATPAAERGFTLGAGQTRFGPTGQPVASVPATPGGEGGFTLSPGQTRYGAGGQVVASRPPTPATASEKPSTGAEKRALNFFNRARQADTDLAAIEGEIAQLGLVGQGRLQFAPNFAQSQVGQLYNQAQRAFTEARLRKDSGAAIPPHEFESDRQTYFAQPGDSQATLQQKARARAAVLASIGFESGRALGEFYGEDAGSMLDELKTRATPPTTPNGGNSQGGGASGKATRGKSPRIGERRTINGRLAEWDGRGWKAVQ